MPYKDKQKQKEISNRLTKRWRKYKVLAGQCARCPRIREPYRMKNTTCRRCAAKLSRQEQIRNAKDSGSSRNV